MTTDVSWKVRLAARSANPPRAPEPTAEQLRAVIERHNLDVSIDAVTRLGSIGTVNTALALGARYVLRIPKAFRADDTRTESVAAPVAKAAGIRTPALVVYDDSETIFDVPFTVYERVVGDNFGLSNLAPEVSGHVYRQIGRELALLHEHVTLCPDPHGYLKEPHRGDPGHLLEHLGSQGLLSSYNIQWLTRVFRRLQPAVESARQYRRFLHNDALPTNVIVHSGSFAALIDWNDSGWGDPALEFVSFPCRAIPSALAGYEEVRLIDEAETAAHRMLWDHLCHALEFLMTPANPENISWARPPFARLTEVLAMAARHEPWQQLLA